MFTHGSYTVAWVCALPLELAAAKAVLDEIHPSLPQNKSDQNVYTLGSASGHNIVLACLPSGVYGTISAAAVVSHLMSTYPNIRFGLMVGIGGGVPRENPDIRLGDIVVSKPTDTSGGVIQYDYGKTLQNGHLYPTGFLQKPPPLLLKAIAQTESDYILGKSPFGGIMSRASALQEEEVQRRFRRPSNDKLFHPTSDHVGDSPDCTECDQSQLVARPERSTKEPRVYYGLIASGNQVMRDGKTRDLIAQGRGILCFEMEAAGLMDIVPSLIIRGICDYCDSHKQKEWQGYAAFAAAAYAKTVLIQVPLQERSQQTAYLTESGSGQRHWMVPFYRNPRFVGREEELATVEEFFKTGQPKVAICGLGGVGKTQIAIEFAHRLRKRKPACSIYWIPCTSYVSVEQAYMDIAQTIGLQVKTSKVKEHVKAHLSQRGQNWLLILDNADDMNIWCGGSAASAELTDFLPRCENGYILFTTRNRKLAVKIASSSVVNIVEPDAETGVKIFEKTLIGQGLLDDKDAAITLLEQLSFLPLAITQAAAYINANSLAISDYTALLQEQESAVIELLSEDFGDRDEGRYKDVQSPVATTWLISFQQIQQLDPLAADYLSFMACISPLAIPQDLLPEAASRKKRADAVGLLKAFSFVSEQIKGRTLSLHPLVYLSTRNWLRKEQQFSLYIHRTAVHFLQVFPNDDYKNQNTWRHYLPHALTLIGEGDFQKEREKYIKLLRNMARCLRADGRYNEAAAVFQDIVELKKGRMSASCHSISDSMSELAFTYWNQGQWGNAEELEKQTMEICKQALGLEHPNTLASIANLACTYRCQGQYKEAEELEKQTMHICNEVLGPGHSNTLIIMANLACTYRYQEQYKEAEELEEHVLRTRMQVLGPDHPDILAIMSNMACTHRCQGQYKEAEKLEVQVLKACKQALGPEHPDTLGNMANLACTYKYQGRHKEAEKLESEILKTSKQVLGPEHPDTLTIMANLASTYQHQDQYTSAEELGAQVLQARKRVLGPEHPSTLSSMASLAYTWHFQDKVHDALSLIRECVTLRSRVLGASHPLTESSSHSLRAWEERVNW